MISSRNPDIHFGPGYAWNNGNAGDNQWSLGLTVTLPVLNHNQGPVAEAEAKRIQAAAHFLTAQANAVAEIDNALAGYRAALRQIASANVLRDSSQKQLDSIRAQERLGEVDTLTLANAEAEFSVNMQNQLDAMVKAQQALGALEDAVQNPLTLSPENFKAAENHFSEIQK